MIIQRQVWEGRQTKYRQKKRSGGEERSQRAENWWTQTWIALAGFWRGWKSTQLRSVQGTNLLECLESSFIQTWPQSWGEWWVLIFERMAEWKTEKRSDLVRKDNWRSQRSSAHSLFWEQSSLRIRKRKGRRSDRMQRNFNKRPENEPSQRSTVGCEAIFSEDKIPSLKEWC